MLPEKAFQPIGKRMTLEGGGSPAGPTNTTVTNTNIPDYAQPYVMNMLNAAQSQIYNASGTGFNAYTPYSNNPANYVAGFSPLQSQAQSTAANMTLPGQFGAATNATNSALQGLAGLSYNPQTGGYMSTSAPSLSNYSMTGPGNVAGAMTSAAQTGAAPTSTAAQLGAAPTAQAAQFQGPGNVSSSNVNAPNLSMYQMGGVNAVNAPGMQTTNMQAAQTGYNPALNTYQMGPASQVSTQDFTQPGTAQQYMNPYLSASLDPQLKEIQRQYDVTGQQEQSGATQAGAFGGSREALMAAENQRNAGTAKNQAITQGYNTAFNNAQSQFNAQQAANLQAQQANQAAGINVGGQNLNAALGVQQLGANTGLQTSLANLSNAQQANVQNQAAQLQASGMNATQALQAALANQTMGYNVGNTNLNAALGIQQLGAGQNLSAQQLNQSSGLQAALANQGMNYNTALQNAQFGQQAGLANQALAGQYGLQNASMAQQSGLANQALAGQYGLQNTANLQAANLANQQSANQANLANQNMGFNTQNANLQSLLGVQSLGSGQNMQSQLANQSAAAQAQQLAAQQQQFGANLGLQGLQAQIGAANQLGNLGTSQLAAQTNLLGTQNTLGAQQQAQQQQIINQAIQNYATAQQYPYMQLGTLNSMLRGLPMSQPTTSMYQAAPSTVSQLAGLGTAALGASSLLPKIASGGYLKDKVAKFDNGGLVPMKMMSNQQLQQVQSSPAEDPIAKLAAQGQMGLNGYITNNPQAQKVFSQPLPLPQQGQGLPPQQQVAQMDPSRSGIGAIGTGDMTKMAGGGILAFAGGEEVKSEWDDDSGIDPGVVRDQVRGENLKLAPDFGFNPTAAANWEYGVPKAAPKAAPINNNVSDAPIEAPLGLPDVSADPNGFPRNKDGHIDWETLIAGHIGQKQAQTAIKEQVDAIQNEIKDRKANMKDEALMRLGLGLMAAPNRTGHNWADFLSNVGTAGTGAVNWMSGENKENVSDQQKLAELTNVAAKADQSRDDQLIQAALVSENALAGRVATADQTKMYKDLMQQQKANELIEKSNIQFGHLVEEEKKNLINQTKFKNLPPETINAMAWNTVVTGLPPNFLKMIGNPTVRPVPQKPKAAPPPPGVMDSIHDWWYEDDAHANIAPPIPGPQTNNTNIYLDEYNRRKAAQNQG